VRRARPVRGWRASRTCDAGIALADLCDCQPRVAGVFSMPMRNIAFASGIASVLLFACSSTTAPTPGGTSGTSGTGDAGGCACSVSVNGTPTSVACGSSACLNSVTYTCDSNAQTMLGGACTVPPTSTGTCVPGPGTFGKCPAGCDAFNSVGWCATECNANIPCPSGGTCNTKSKSITGTCLPSCTVVADCPKSVKWAECNPDGYCE
jgi:hypothetical protein